MLELIGEFSFKLALIYV